MWISVFNVVDLLVSVVCVANLLSPLHRALWPLPPPRQATPPLFWTNPPHHCCFWRLSLFPFLFLLLLYMSSDSSTPSSLLWFCLSSFVPSLFSSCRRGMQPNVKRGNLIVSVAFAAFTPAVYTTQKVKNCRGGPVTDRWTPVTLTLTPPTAGMEHPVLEKPTLPRKQRFGEFQCQKCPDVEV